MKGNLMFAEPFRAADGVTAVELKGLLVDLLGELLAAESEEEERDVMRRIDEAASCPPP